MDFGGKYSLRSRAVKRLMREAQELRDATDQYFARPLDDNLFEWHFTVKGPSDSEFDNGLYHGRIILPPEYPMKPPNIILLTPNGRFETNKKICLSISDYHPETWQPSWSIRTALLALRAFMPTPGKGTIGSLDYTVEERKQLAIRSQLWECDTCGKLTSHLNNQGAANVTTDEESNLIKKLVFKEEKKDNEREGEEPQTEGAAILDKKEVGTNEVTEISNTSVFEEVQGNNEPNVLHQIDETVSPSQCYKNSFVNFFIGVIVAAIAFLIYRRIYLIQ